jgi:GTP-binding protein HflX
VWISAVKSQGIGELSVAIGEMLGKNIIKQEVVLTPDQAKLRAELYSRGAVVAEKIDEEGRYHLQIRLPQMDFEKLFR